MWAMWGEWSNCSISSSCKVGIAIRARACSTPALGGVECQGKSTETKSCKTSGDNINHNTHFKKFWNLKGNWTELYYLPGNTTSVEFFESAFTFANETSNVTCCHPNNLTTAMVTCGLGASCAGQCSAIGATLCPSEVCTKKSSDCELNMDVWSQSSQRSTPTRSSSAFRWCYPRCDVNTHPSCCYNPECYSRHTKVCQWKSFMTGRNHCSETLRGGMFMFQGRLAHSLEACLMEPGLVRCKTSPSTEPLSLMKKTNRFQVYSILEYKEQLICHYQWSQVFGITLRWSSQS